MEKLQSAIEKARVKRSGTPSTPAKPAAKLRRAASTGSNTLDTLWHDVPEFQPSPAHLEKQRIMTSTASAASTPFDILRTKILLQMRQNNWTRLAITSPTPGSGKTTMACNMAIGLGRQRDLRSMMFDLDLRKPRAAKALGMNLEHCVTSVLSGEVSVPEQGYRLGENVIMCLSNKVSEDPTSILLNAQTEERLDEIQEEYKPDLMLFDLPPMLVSDDTRAFLKLVDCALIVTRANQTRYSQFDKTEAEIAAHTNVLGVVLNGSGSFSEDEGDFYGY